ncbi:MAG: hypothetical protein AB7G87_10580 [Clostridia bacterium]
MIKRLLQAMIVLIILSIATVGFAAPDEMETDDVGTATDLITIVSHEEKNITTYNDKEILSGSGQEGVTITLYVYNAEADNYKKVILTEDDVEKALEIELGASGLFAHELQLSEGVNRFALRAELNEDKYQVEKLEFDYKKGFVNTIKDISIGFKDVKDLFNNIKK